MSMTEHTTEGFRRAAAGRPNGVFLLSPQELLALTGAPVHDVVMVE